MSMIRDSELRTLLVDGKFDEFNERAGDAPPDLENTHLRGFDLREADLSHANLLDAYLRFADLRGLDLLYAEMDGASIQGAKISGTRFPRNLTIEEISFSLQHGTRMRTTRTVAAPAAVDAPEPVANAEEAAEAVDSEVDGGGETEPPSADATGENA